MKLEYLLENYRPGSGDDNWTWEDEEDMLYNLPCPAESAPESLEFVCDDPSPGCYQRKLEAYLREVGEVKQPVYPGPDGRIWDGHHRIVAAKRIGFTDIPTEQD